MAVIYKALWQPSSRLSARFATALQGAVRKGGFLFFNIPVYLLLTLKPGQMVEFQPDQGILLETFPVSMGLSWPALRIDGPDGLVSDWDRNV